MSDDDENDRDPNKVPPETDELPVVESVDLSSPEADTAYIQRYRERVIEALYPEHGDPIYQSQTEDGASSFRITRKELSLRFAAALVVVVETGFKNGMSPDGVMRSTARTVGEIIRKRAGAKRIIMPGAGNVGRG